MAKSGVGPLTVKLNVCDLAEGAPAAVAEIDTTTGPPCGVPAAAVTVSETVTGDEDVGLTELDGEKTHAAPDGSPVGQPSVTGPEKLPAAVTWKVLVPDVPPGATVSEFGFGVVRLKSTIWSVTVRSRVRV